ncbi:MAG: arsenite efflux transporter metallochaperone ArsD [Sutterella sp.]|nr:arsenite efflux transporter metallochaperone ArsD [Sutterella sp.]
MNTCTLSIYEPALCCETGLCGVSIDPELLRITTAVKTLKAAGFAVERYNLKSAPMAFISNATVKAFLNHKGQLPLTLLNGEEKLSGRYPTNDELCAWTGAPQNLLATHPTEA